MNKKKRIAALKHRQHQKKLKEKRKNEVMATNDEQGSSPNG